MELNVQNMPQDTLYRFDINKYVYTSMWNGDRKIDKPLTAVCEITETGVMSFLAYGELVNHSEIKDYNRGFAIKDYSSGKTTDFKVTMYLQEVNNEELVELLDAISLNYHKNHK